MFHDVVGFASQLKPRFVRRYAQVDETIVDAVQRYVEDVKGGAFPSDDESYHVDDERVREILDGAP